MNHRIAFLFFLIVVRVPTAFSQPFGPPDGGPGKRIEQLRKVRLVEMLELTEEQSVRFFARLNEFEKKRDELHKQKMDLLDRIERLVRNEADDQEFDKIFPEIRAVDQKLAEEHEKFFGGLSDLLSIRQRGKYLLFERQFERELREAMREIQRRRHRGGE